MPFEAIPTMPVVKRTASQASMSYCKMATKHGRAKTPRLIISIPKQLADGFKPKDDSLFELQVGTGPDRGKARIVPSKDGAPVSDLMHCWKFRFGYVPLLGSDGRAEKTFVDLKKIGKDTFEIVLPEWFSAIREVA